MLYSGNKKKSRVNIFLQIQEFRSDCRSPHLHLSRAEMKWLPGFAERATRTTIPCSRIADRKSCSGCARWTAGCSERRQSVWVRGGLFHTSSRKVEQSLARSDLSFPDCKRDLWAESCKEIRRRSRQNGPRTAGEMFAPPSGEKKKKAEKDMCKRT